MLYVLPPSTQGRKSIRRFFQSNRMMTSKCLWGDKYDHPQSPFVMLCETYGEVELSVGSRSEVWVESRTRDKRCLLIPPSSSGIVLWNNTVAEIFSRTHTLAPTLGSVSRFGSRLCGSPNPWTSIENNPESLCQQHSVTQSYMSQWKKYQTYHLCQYNSRGGSQ